MLLVDVLRRELPLLLYHAAYRAACDIIMRVQRGIECSVSPNMFLYFLGILSRLLQSTTQLAAVGLPRSSPQARPQARQRTARVSHALCVFEGDSARQGRGQQPMCGHPSHPRI